MKGTMYRAVLRLYPPEFRAEYGEEMSRVYADLRRDESRVSSWLRLARDTALAAPRSRMEEGMKPNVLAIGAVAALGIAVTGIVTGHFFVGGLIFLGVSALLVIPSALLARRARASAEHDYKLRRWAFWTFPAVTVAILYVVLGIGQLVRETKKEHVFALVAAIGFSSMISAGLWLRSKGHVSGNWMIAVACLPLFSVFWIIWPPVIAGVVMIGSMTEAMSVRRPHLA